MKKVITYGNFDALHVGHINLLRRAKELGGYLIVALSTDEFSFESKGKKTLFTYQERLAALRAAGFADEIIPEENWEQKSLDIKKYEVDVFVIGNDWEGKFDFLKNQCEVIYLPRTEGISTSMIKERLLSLNES